MLISYNFSVRCDLEQTSPKSTPSLNRGKRWTGFRSRPNLAMAPATVTIIKQLRLQIFKKELAPALLNFKNWLRLQGFFKTSPAKAAAECYAKLQ